MKRETKWAITKYIILTIIGVLLFRTASAAATQARGYSAIGGEAAFLFLPLVWWIAGTVVRDWRDIGKDE
jgi:drug/metabolite transporter superfamily protein YnfA